MRLNPYCICCQINQQEKKLRQFSDPERKLEYMKKVLLRFANTSDTDCSPNIASELTKLFSEYWNVPVEDFTEIKKEFNQLMMNAEEDLRKNLFSCEDPLKVALAYARIANYIDFSALSHVNKTELLSLIHNANTDPVDSAEYQNFKNDLENADTLVYLTDNCGEIVMDKLVIELLKKYYPHLKIQVIVRGFPAVNDATMEDAHMCGLTEIVPVIGNGSDICGTWFPGISDEAKSKIENADIIISKGQGNFETLNGCGYNIYYLFLCKCEYFVNLFHTELFKGMFVNEKRLSFSSD